MTVLIVATSTTPENIVEEVRGDGSHRIDYVELAKRLGATCVDYNAISSHGSIGRLEGLLRMDLRQAAHVREIVHDGPYDVVFSMSERVGIPLGLILGRDVKHVMLGHHLLSGAKVRLIKVLRVASSWDLIIAPTAAEAEAVQREFRLPPDRVKTVYNTVDTKFYRPHPEVSVAGESDHILSLGLAHRDYPTLMKALGELPRVNCHVSANSLWLSGNGSGEGKSLPKNVRLEPYVPTCLVRERYRECRFVVVPIVDPTTHWSAGTSTVTVAQAMGKAVVATRNPGMAEYVIDGETGILVEGGSAEAMAGAIQHLWDHPEVAAAMGHRARERAEACFSLDRWLNNMCDLFADLAGY